MKFPADDLRFLRELARDVIEAARVKPGQRVGDSPANTLGHAVIRPGGRDCYPAVFKQYIAHLREQDFRRGDALGAPWECFGRDGAARQNPVYMTSVTLPLGV